ncbi:hypothetical protein FQN60_018488 [Etheostoma spectabile]|uniref:Uncharacterized protein n=1 Tax=Etheostoma spectabile TaxID=54343 RepID=A0A5J5DIF0_9PERO|nr:hypothetical protein FQN60_018488 [Etheostoma spectabile]
MGLTKQYLRYVSSAVFGVIGSQKANVAYVTLRGGERGRYVAVAACEHVFIWDARKGEKVLILQGQKHEVTFLCPSPDGVHIAVGYEDGAVRIFSLLNGESNVSFNGHKTSVSVMQYDALGARLVTGSKVWGMVLLNQENRLLTGSADSELRAWDINYLQERILSCKKAGSILREARDRVVSLATDSKARVIACHGNDSVLELFTVLSEEEVQKKMTKKVKKAKKKAAKWVDCLSCAGGELKVALLLQNNTIETYSLRTSDKTPTANKTARLTLGGHRTDVRTLAFSSDNLAVLSASGDTVKVWNRSTLQVIRTMACEYALCSLFVPGDRQIILGSKSGKLQIFELASGSLLETVDAHNGALWSLCLAPDQRGIVTGSADKTVKFWEFELVKDEETGQKLLAVSLLDCTVKVFYTDTLKFFLSLYGHKLPVLCLDISHDNTLIATGSADRNVKIWGLDFGDCHRSMFAHDDSVMFLQFVPKTHLFFTAGKDKKIKQWDADKFEHIQTLEVTLGFIPLIGDHIVSSSHDKSLRLWERTREPIILDEEREMEREAEFEESMAKGDVPVVPGETEGEAAPASKKTVETVKAAERIMEALELYKEENRKMEVYKYACQTAGNEVPPPRPNPILVAFGNVSPSRYVLDVVKKVRSSELEVSLLVLPFPYIPELLTLFNSYIKQGLEVELVCRCLFFLLKIHFGQISSNQMLLSVIDELRTNTVSKVREIRDVMGFNSAALQFLQREIESKEDVMFFADATGQLAEKKKKRRKRERAILTIA